MTAPQIPNLLESLRKSKDAGSRGGFRGGLRKPPGSGPSTDAIIQQTDDDAAGSRQSAVDVGLLHDPYARIMSFSKPSVRRMPIINRGTYVRTVAIDALVEDFLQEHTDKDLQVISLGAGTDTRPFRRFQQRPRSSKHLLYHEIDFAECTRKKVTAITNANLLSDVHVQQDGTGLVSTEYRLHPLDLRKLATSSGRPSHHNPCNEEENLGLTLDIDPLRPTLLLSECCLTYLNSTTAVSILERFLQTLLRPGIPVSIVLYEPLHPNDAFGRTMTSNLSSRGISLPGLQACPTIKDHQQRLGDCGFEKTGGMAVKDWWRTRVSDDEKERLRSLEGLDEEEEWDLLAAHYGFVWASKGESNWPKTDATSL